MASGAGPFGAVLFDLDGTLIDSSAVILASYRHTMRVHRGEVPPDAAWRRGMGRPLVDQLREFAQDEAELRAMFRTYREHNERIHDEMVRPFPGVVGTLRRLRERGVPLGIVTSKKRDGVQMGLRACGLREAWFRVLVTADDVSVHKPEPEPVRRALSAMEPGIPPGEVLFVGDTVHDLRSGRAAGVRTAAALWGPSSREELAPASPDHWLRRVEEVLTLLGS